MPVILFFTPRSEIVEYRFMTLCGTIIFMVGAHLFCAQNKEKYNYYCLDEKNLQAILGGIQKVDVIYESRLQ